MSIQENQEKTESSNFIERIIEEDLKNGKNGGKLVTRFPPEPNGYLHIGHAKSIVLNFSLAEKYNGRCHLRFDDTNPAKEEQEYIDSIIEDVKWLGFDWKEHLYFASDYFERMHAWAIDLIKAGKAFVCDLGADEIREYRGTLKNPGKPSPWRDRSVEENLELFRRMGKGEFPDGSRTLRAKIDMSSGNLNMRDPVIYRILHKEHHRQGSKWCIYPMYDWAHGFEDALEGITHSICTLEFEDHRPLYDWFLDQVDAPCHPRQIEFARLNLNYTVMSKRKLLDLVESGKVSGWDDPRMPTISGLRRRGYTPESIRTFCGKIGVAKTASTVDIGLLEHCLRETLNKTALRVMAVLEPLKITIKNYPEGQTEWFDAENNPEDPAAGTRRVPFTRQLYIEREDFMEVPVKGFHRLYPGNEIRLKHAYYIKCEEVIKNAAGEVTELVCTYDPASRGGWTDDGRKIRGTSHWVSAEHCIRAEVRVYENLFNAEDPSAAEEGKSFTDYLNPDSVKVLSDCLLELSLKNAVPGVNYQFLRQGYFCSDKDSTAEKPVFNRTVSLKDSWPRVENRA